MKTYTYELKGTVEQVEKSLRNLDKSFRSLYNVYGAKRLESRMDRNTGLYMVRVGLTAGWWSGWTTVYDLYDVLRIWHRQDAHQGLEDVEYERVD